MAITVSAGTTYTPHPPGQFRAVCVDVVELGDVATQYGPRPMVRLIWQTEHRLPDGQLARASARFGASLSSKGRLRPFLEAWRGRPFTDDELRGFDLEQLLGAGAILQIQHNTDPTGRVWDDITACMRLMAGMQPVTPTPYQRVKDRPQQAAQAAPARGATPVPPTPFDDLPDALDGGDDDDSLPF